MLLSVECVQVVLHALTMSTETAVCLPSVALCKTISLSHLRDGLDRRQLHIVQAFFKSIESGQRLNSHLKKLLYDQKWCFENAKHSFTGF